MDNKSKIILYDNQIKNNNIEYKLSTLLTKIDLLIEYNIDLTKIINEQSKKINLLYDLIEYNDINDINEKYNYQL